MAIKFEAGTSTGVPITIGETRTVVVTDEAGIPIYPVYEGEPLTYTATVKDSEGESLPTSFLVSLEVNGTKVVTDQVLDAAHYDPIDGSLTLDFAVPAAGSGTTVKLSWAEQTI